MSTYALTADAASSSPDLAVTINEEDLKGSPPAKPGFFASKRNRWLTAGALALLVAIPCIVAPIVVTQQNKDAANSQSLNGADPSSAVGSDGTGGGDQGVPRGIAVDGSDLDTTAVDASDTLKNPLAGRKNATRTGKAGVAEWESEVISPYIGIENGVFDHECRPYYPTGFNAFELTTLAASSDKDAVDEAFRKAHEYGMNSARTWAHSIAEQLPFQTAPGKYDEAGLKALDYVLDSASRHNITLILSLIDNWKYYNGVDQFVDWSTTAPGRTMQRPTDANGDTDSSTWTEDQRKYEAARHALFFTDEQARKMYKAHVDYITSRKNTINGRVYKNDPTILSWNLINEPRCEEYATAGCTDLLDAWYTEMAAHVKKADPNHLVSSGSEGFFAGSNSMNPASWAGETGQDFSRNNAQMDFAVTHAWPDNWNIPDDQQGSFLGQWLRGHLDAAKAIGKPLLFEEFGKKLDDASDDAIGRLRDPVYREAYKAIEEAVQTADQPLLGSLYWKWAFPKFGVGPYGVEPNDSTMDIIETHAKRMRSLSNQTPPRPGCVMPIPSKPEGRPLGAWFASPSKRVCVNVPQASLAWHTLYGPNADVEADPAAYSFTDSELYLAQALSEGRTLVFATEAACCARGSGGLGNEGCASMGGNLGAQQLDTPTAAKATAPATATPVLFPKAPVVRAPQVEEVAPVEVAPEVAPAAEAVVPAPEPVAVPEPVPEPVGPVVLGPANEPGSWFASPSQSVCVNVPSATEAFNALYGPAAGGDASAYSSTDIYLAQALAEGRTTFYSTEAACCAPGSGGLGAEGCASIGGNVSLP